MRSASNHLGVARSYGLRLIDSSIDRVILKPGGPSAEATVARASLFPSGVPSHAPRTNPCTPTNVELSFPPDSRFAELSDERLPCQQEAVQ
jgi:hypothetical protein